MYSYLMVSEVARQRMAEQHEAARKASQRRAARKATKAQRNGAAARDRSALPRYLAAHHGAGRTKPLHRPRPAPDPRHLGQVGVSPGGIRFLNTRSNRLLDARGLVSKCLDPIVRTDVGMTAREIFSC